MISIEEAINQVIKHTSPLSTQMVDIMDAIGSVVADDIYSPISIPPFDQSAMDGYAVCHGSDAFQLIDEIKAGDNKTSTEIKTGEAVRIFTGAMIPKGATGVAKQEIVTVNSDQSIHLNESVSHGENIRKKGEEITANEIAVPKGTMISSSAIGFLASLGIEKVNVYRKPKIAILVTGNELVPVGSELQPGEIYESNSYTLRAVLKKLDLDCTVQRVQDNFQSTLNELDRIISTHDLVLTTGGISVGDYDFVGDALNQLGVEQLFYKVNQKPGKPVFFGKKKSTMIFALPGNPAAVLTCFYVYALPSIAKMMCKPNLQLNRKTKRLKKAFTKRGTRGFLLKGKITNHEVEILKKQSSAMLSSFIEANCLVYLEDSEKEYKEGDLVETIPLP